MNRFEVQSFDHNTNTVYYDTVTDVIDYTDAHDIIEERYPDRKVIAVNKI